MAIIGQTYPQLIDMHKANGPGQVIEILSQDNPILDDAIARACNMGATERTLIRTGLPSASWGRLYKGVKQSKSTMQQVDDTTGFLEARSEVDTRLLKLAKDPARQRLVESAPYFEAMNQEMAAGLFYHDIATTPEKFKGLSARYSMYYSGAKSGAPKSSASQVVDGGGRGNDNTSIWFVTWGDHATSLLYPEGTQAGVTMQDKGEEKVLDANGDAYYAKVATYEWHIGTTVKDWRYNARIANIDVSDLLAGSVDAWKLLRQGYYRLKSRRRDGKSSRIAIYMNSDVLEVLDAQSSDRALLAANANTVSLGHAQVEGKEVRTYRGIPIRETDALLNTEAAVPAFA
ncbi:major capsid protein [Hyphomicrobium sp. ghe19]|uniref:major capsid protein n=1 Tax=Hyphomicrobium sp. ghe19 TaxID=2682968 RepID=UPI00136768B0|nr:hypothetical protein HYPP_01949 [Hyphomicrobium sp. ghe19]